MSTMTISSLVGPVVLSRGLGDEPGTLEIVERNGKPHAYVNTDAGLRVHVPFAPGVERTVSGRALVLGVKEDRSSGDLRRIGWSLRSEKIALETPAAILAGIRNNEI